MFKIKVVVSAPSFQFFRGFFLVCQESEQLTAPRYVRVVEHTLSQALPVPAEMNSGDKGVWEGHIVAEVAAKRFSTLD